MELLQFLYGPVHTNKKSRVLLPGDGGDPYPPLCVGVLVLGYKLDHPSATLGDWCIVLHKQTHKTVRLQSLITILFHELNKWPSATSTKKPLFGQFC